MGAGRPAACLVACWLTCVGSPARAADVHYTVGGRADLRARNAQPGASGPMTGELELLPLAGLQLGHRATSLELTYRPSVLLRPYASEPIGLLQAGQAQLRQAFHRVTLGLTGVGEWGVTDASALRPGAAVPPGLHEVATAGLLPYVRLSGSGSLDAVLTRRLTLHVSAGYQYSGTPDAPAGQELTLPLQWGPFAEARLGWAPNARDAFTTRLQASDTEFSFGQHNTVAQGTQGWRRAFDARTALDLAAGVAFARTFVPDIDNPNLTVRPLPGLFTEVLPVAQAQASHRFVADGTVEVRGSVLVGPYADRYTGNVYERLDASAQVTWRPARGLEAIGNLGGGWAVDVGRGEQRGDRIASADAQVAWAFSRWLTWHAQAALAYSEQPSYELRGWQWLVGVGMSVRHRGALAP